MTHKTINILFHKISTILAITLIVLVLALPLRAQESQKSESGPLLRVRTTIEEIVNVVEGLPGDDKKLERREKLRKLINPVFDFQEMAKRSLGPHWKECTPEEQSEFIAVFSDLLAKTYLGKIETVKRGMVKVDSESVEAAKAIVKTTVTTKGESFPLDYKLQEINGTWKVYDVVIENIGLVANYRNEFAGIVRKDKLSGLIQKLKAKQDE